MNGFGRMHTGDLFDYRPECSKGIMTQLPPKLVGTPYPALVPKTDTDGNDIAGVRLPDVAAPIATYTGWALRAGPAGANDGCDGAGQRSVRQDQGRADGQWRSAAVARGELSEAYVTPCGRLRTISWPSALLDEDVQTYERRAETSQIGR
jgi:hypothetical protein